MPCEKSLEYFWKLPTSFLAINDELVNKLLLRVSNSIAEQTHFPINLYERVGQTTTGPELIGGIKGS